MLEKTPLWDFDDVRVFERVVQIANTGCLLRDFYSVVLTHLREVPLEDDARQRACGPSKLMFRKLLRCVQL